MKNSTQLLILLGVLSSLTACGDNRPTGDVVKAEINKFLSANLSQEQEATAAHNKGSDFNGRFAANGEMVLVPNKQAPLPRADKYTYTFEATILGCTAGATTARVVCDVELSGDPGAQLESHFSKDKPRPATGNTWSVVRGGVEFVKMSDGWAMVGLDVHALSKLLIFGLNGMI